MKIKLNDTNKRFHSLIQVLLVYLKEAHLACPSLSSREEAAINEKVIFVEVNHVAPQHLDMTR